jgi:hypothetical protein
MCFGQDANLVRAQVEHAVGDDHVDTRVCDGQRLDLTETELDIVEATLLCVGAGTLEHLGGHVDPDHLPSGTDLLGRQEAVDSGSGAQIEDHLALGE